MKFNVLVREVHIQAYEVEAKNEDEATEKVDNQEGSIIEEYFEYSHTLDRSLWTVENIGKEGKKE